VDLAADRVTLTLYFFGNAPADLAPANISIEGGTRIQPVVVDVRLGSADDPERTNCALITLDGPGDASVYTIRVSGLENFDPLFSSLRLSFALDCLSDLDCAKRPRSSARAAQEPDLNYLVKDYASFRQLMLDRLALNLPQWQEQHAADFGIVLVELLAYAADNLSYYQDAVATEAYLSTARQRISVRRHLRLIDYQLNEGCNSRAWIHVASAADVTLDSADILFATGAPPAEPPVAELDALLRAGSGTFEYFEPMRKGALALYAAHNSIAIHDWGNQSCRLPQGTTSVWLVDETAADAGQQAGTENGRRTAGAPERILGHLRPGMFLLFEETASPDTGSPDDADAAHRHVVRIERVEKTTDNLLGISLLNVSWAVEDALPFDLIYRAITPPTNADAGYESGECIPRVTAVARGNLLLADHGRTISGEPLPPVPQAEMEPGKCRDGRVQQIALPQNPWRPALAKGPVTFRTRVNLNNPAARALTPAPDQATPAVTLTTAVGAVWTALPDLLASGATDPVFVAEIDDSGFAHLRFGDGVNGAAPVGGQQFNATYRVGNGIQGNVGAETIGTLVFRGSAPKGLEINDVKNPMPAAGGVNPEPVAIARLAGPYAMKNVLERAVTADDYAALAERNPAVQRAAATIRWTGHRQMARVAVDTFGTDDPSDRLLKQIQAELEPYRRIGHDIEVVPATYVAIDLELTICVKPEWLRGHVELALLDLLSNATLPDGTTGLFHPDRLTFGQSIFGSQLIAAVMAVDGVETVKIDKLARMFLPPLLEEEKGVLRIGPLEIAQLDNAGTVETGVLKLTMAGGR